MSTLQVTNVHFETSGNCRIQFIGSNTVTVSTASSERMRFNSTGEIFIAGTTDQGAYNLQVNGTGVWGAGAYLNGSDSRIKNSIQSITSSLDVVKKLNPVTFKYNENWSSDSSIQPGFIAQELKDVLKDEIYVDGVVQQGPEYMSVAYQALIPVLTKALQEINEKIDSLKLEFEQYKNLQNQ